MSRETPVPGDLLYPSVNTDLDGEAKTVYLRDIRERVAPPLSAAVWLAAYAACRGPSARSDSGGWRGHRPEGGGPAEYDD